MVVAAGFMVTAPSPVDGTDTVLMLLRGPAADHPFEWCFPGGGADEGEASAACAVRETLEECGLEIDDDIGEPWLRTVIDGVDFTTFRHRVKAQFTPALNDEHVGYCWAPPAHPPGPAHPGSFTALEKLGWDELGLADAMAAGRVLSPQRYDNVTLFCMRVTGTGAAYRRGVSEFVWREPGVYLNDEFLRRATGLPVIWIHPPKATLDSEEFSRRVIGTTFVTYIKGDEVWAVCKVYDDEAIAELVAGRLSTSPTVVFRDPTVNERVELEDGSRVLIEGKPSLLDHLAVCAQGVWDKGGEPVGVDTSAVVTPVNEPEPAALADSDIITRARLSGLRARRLGLRARLT